MRGSEGGDEREGMREKGGMIGEGYDRGGVTRMGRGEAEKEISGGMGGEGRKGTRGMGKRARKGGEGKRREGREEKEGQG